MSPVIGADEDLGLRESVLDPLDDLQRRLGVVDADHHRIGLGGAGLTQDVQPRVVA